MTTLKAFCKAAGWPRLRRWSQAIERVKEAEAVAVSAASAAPVDQRMTIREVSERLIEGGAHSPSAGTSNLIAYDDVTGDIRWWYGDDAQAPGWPADAPMGLSANHAWAPAAEAEAFISRVLPLMRKEAEGASRARAHFRRHGRPKRP